jgi:hypothetical protein
VGWNVCINPTNTDPYSIPYIVATAANDLFRVSVGSTGTLEYGGDGGPCFDPQVAFDISGGIGFGSGPIGSVQSNADNDMMYTMGMPEAPAGNWSKAWVRRVDPTDPTNVTTELIGDNVTGTFFYGASARYIKMQNIADGVQTDVRTDVVGDGCRVTFTMTNLNDTPQQLGLWYGATPAILLGSGSDATGMLGSSQVYTVVPGKKPLRVDTRIRRAADPANFPPYVQFLYGQTTGYGLQVDLGPTDSTKDINGQSDATLADELVVGVSPFVIGPADAATTTTPPGDFIFGDLALWAAPPFYPTMQFIVKWEPQSGGAVPTNGTRKVVAYFRDTWGNSKYARPTDPGQPQGPQPYSAVADAPHVIATDDNGTGTNGLANNPFTIRVYIDNTGGYTLNGTQSRIDDTFVTLNLPAGLSIANSDPATKQLTTVQPFEIRSVEWQVVADGVHIGDLPYSVNITSIPQPLGGTTLNGTIRVAATKQLNLEPAANLVSLPWVFGDSSWETVLGLSSPTDFTAYEWNPASNSYVISTSATRAKGAWIILNPNAHPSGELVPLNGATTPTDMLPNMISGAGGAPNTQLKGGWNLIGNPYPYAIPVSQLVGVPASNPTQGFSFAQLVSQGIVTPYLAYWDPAVNNYRYAQGIEAMLQPHRGYWIKVQSSQNLTLVWPAVTDTFVPGGRAEDGNSWSQSPSHWRLALQAKTPKGEDQENYLGVATQGASQLQIPEPPEGPTQDVTLSFDGAIAGQSTRLAQAMSSKNANQQWKAFVTSKAGGYTTLSWPNLATLPSNMTFKLVDAVTRQAVNMRSRTSVSFMMQPNSTKQFYVQVSSSGAVAPTIGNVSASTGRLRAQTPVAIGYELNYDANVTIRVLDSSNRVVATLVDHVDRMKGSNAATWNLRNSGGFFVLPGNYTVQIQATVDGQTVSKVVTASVLR